MVSVYLPDFRYRYIIDVNRDLANAIWLIQLRGVVILIKLGLLAILAHTTVWQNELLICIIFISGIIAHAPANMRYFSILHGKRIDSLY